MEIEIYQVDSFTEQAFKGNPAGVCITDQGLSETLMLQIAAEMAVSETAFLSLNDMRLRWFTPKVEVALCGHGTLAVTHILNQKGLLCDGESMSFTTLSGALWVTVQQGKIEMDFPAPSIDYSFSPSEEMLQGLGLTENEIVSSGLFESKVLIEIDNEADLRNLNPNFDGLTKFAGRSVVITARAETTEPVDFISRNFAPWVGVNEDPVTGSAHCALAVHWAAILNRSSLKGYQASQRGGFVDVELMENDRVILMGKAVTVIKGTMIV